MKDFQRIIDKALDKDPETRYQHIDDLLSDLKREKKESSESIITDSNSYKQYKKPKRKKYIIAVSILIMLLLGFGAYYIFNNKTKEIKPAKHTQITYEGTIFFSGLPNLLTEITQISPDGRYTAYVVDNKKNRMYLYSRKL